MKRLFSIALLTLASTVSAGEKGRVDPEQITARLDALRQSGALIRWQEVPWQLDLNEGMRQSREEKRPMFLWVAGDDPLERC